MLSIDMNNEQQGAAVAAAAAEAAPTARRWRLTAAVALAAMLAVLLVALGCQRRQEPVFEVLSAPAAAEDAKVYVTGEVAQPGVYPIAPGDRVVDVVARAGGLNPEADTLRINLAVRLQDEMHVHISTRPSTSAGQPAAPPALPPTAAPRSSAAAVGGPPSAAPAGTARRVNINTATIAELEALPGIGIVSARKIVEHRTLHGPYRALDDVRQAGVGAALLRRAAPHLAFE